MYIWRLKELGYKIVEVPETDKYYQTYLDKSNYVANFLSPCVTEADCGWEYVQYFILQSPTGDIEEYVTLGEDNCYCVSGNSKGAIAEEVFKHIF